MKKIVLLLSLINLMFASVANISAIKGDAYRIDTAANKHKLQLNSVIFEDDTIITTSNSRLQLIFQDNTIVTLGKNTIFNIKEYIINGKNSKVNLEVKQGSFKVITGQISKLARENFTLKANTATIGIRGTVFIGEVSNKVNKIACIKGAIDVKIANTNNKINAGKQIIYSNINNIKIDKINLNDFNEFSKDNLFSKDTNNNTGLKAKEGEYNLSTAKIKENKKFDFKDTKEINANLEDNLIKQEEIIKDIVFVTSENSLKANNAYYYKNSDGTYLKFVTDKDSKINKITIFSKKGNEYFTKDYDFSNNSFENVNYKNDILNSVYNGASILQNINSNFIFSSFLFSEKNNNELIYNNDYLELNEEKFQLTSKDDFIQMQDKYEQGIRNFYIKNPQAFTKNDFNSTFYYNGNFKQAIFDGNTQMSAKLELDKNRLSIYKKYNAAFLGDKNNKYFKDVLYFGQDYYSLSRFYLRNYADDNYNTYAKLESREYSIKSIKTYMNEQGKYVISLIVNDQAEGKNNYNIIVDKDKLFYNNTIYNFETYDKTQNISLELSKDSNEFYELKKEWDNMIANTDKTSNKDFYYANSNSALELNLDKDKLNYIYNDNTGAYKLELKSNKEANIKYYDLALNKKVSESKNIKLNKDNDKINIKANNLIFDANKHDSNIKINTSYVKFQDGKSFNIENEILDKVNSQRFDKQNNNFNQNYNKLK